MFDTTSQTNRAEEYFAAKNAFTTGPIEVSEQMERGDNIVIVDVRADEDFRKSHVPGAVNLPEHRWRTLQGLSKEGPNIVYCYSQTCHLASRAAQLFAHEGYPVVEMEGGFEAWKGADLKVEKGS
jgi:rhodanese-related sulfurtransferase